MIVGDWVSRERRGKAHLAESIVSGDAVTRCGRRMKDEPNANGPLMLEIFANQRCLVCLGPAT